MSDIGTLFEREGKIYKLVLEEEELSCHGCVFYNDQSSNYCQRRVEKSASSVFTNAFFEEHDCADTNAIFKEINIVKGKKKLLIL